MYVALTYIPGGGLLTGFAFLACCVFFLSCLLSFFLYKAFVRAYRPRKKNAGFSKKNLNNRTLKKKINTLGLAGTTVYRDCRTISTA